MVASTSTNRMCLAVALVQAVARHAQRQADLVANFLRASGACKDSEEIQVPGAALLELAAVLELGVWERCGIRPQLVVDVPSYREAAEQFAARCMKGADEFKGEDATPLARRVLLVWIEHFAWDGPDTLGAEIVLGDVDEDRLVEVLAEFVWRHRHELGCLVKSEVASSERETL